MSTPTFSNPAPLFSEEWRQRVRWGAYGAVAWFIAFFIGFAVVQAPVALLILPALFIPLRLSIFVMQRGENLFAGDLTRGELLVGFWIIALTIVILSSGMLLVWLTGNRRHDPFN